MTPASYTLDAVADAIAAAAPACVAVCGWSLGAHFALTWARRKPLQVERLVLIAATPRFVTGPDWPHGTPAEVFDEFAFRLDTNPTDALQRFVALQVHGDSRARYALRFLRARVFACALAETEMLIAGLQLLRQTDLRDVLHQIAQPTLLLHGTCDSIVPLAACEFLQHQLPHARLATLAGAAHAPFVTNCSQVAASVQEFCREQ